MFSSVASCSDCKLELVEKRWTQLLLKWTNKCVSSRPVQKLNTKTLADIMAKYKSDVCASDIERAMLCTDDVDPFIKYKYPILRLRYLSEASDIPKRLYISTSILLYHCCINSLEGAVHEDLARELTRYEQDLVLQFCENLSDMEVTINNVDKAIKDAFEKIQEDKEPLDQDESFSDTIAHASSDSTIQDSPTMPSEVMKMLPHKFDSLTVLPSVLTETEYSDLQTDSEDVMAEDVGNAQSVDVYFHGGRETTNETPIKMSSVGDMKNIAISKHKINKDFSHVSEDKETILQEKFEYFDKGHYVQRAENDYTYESAIEKHKISKTLFAKWTGDKEIQKESKMKKKEEIPKCSAAPSGGDSGSTMGAPEFKQQSINQWMINTFQNNILKKNSKGGYKLTWKAYIPLAVFLSLIICIVLASTIPFQTRKSLSAKRSPAKLVGKRETPKLPDRLPLQSKGHTWNCINGLCQKVYNSIMSSYSSYSRCSLLCMGPQIWPLPIGHTKYSKKIVALTTSRLEYKFKSPFEGVDTYVAEAFKMFLGVLVRLEKGHENRDKNLDLPLLKLHVIIVVESDIEPRIKLDTDESYDLVFETVSNQLVVNVTGASFCGVRHGLETLSQLILLDQTTGKLITYSNLAIKDAPSHKYRGLMIDTARNYIPMQDLTRTIDAMATVKLNTFHWRISDVTSFPLILPELPQLFENGAYDRSMVYTKDDVIALAKRAHFRGIRVLIEVAAPGPVGRSWRWSSDVSCQKRDNSTCDVLCLRMQMKDSLFDKMEIIYKNIIEMTKVDDIFHLSNGVFSLSNCLHLVDGREGFLDKALYRLKRANRGFMPELPIVWYSPLLDNDYEAKTWERLGVQLNEMDAVHEHLTKFKVIHSTKWDLSCVMDKHRCLYYRTWQQMYSWVSWRNVEVFTIQGGEAILWSDLVGSGNLDSHLWPRAAAVAERLWSDVAINTMVSSQVYVRLDVLRWRMLGHAVDAQPVWPVWCSFNPGPCLEKLNKSAL